MRVTALLPGLLLLFLGSSITIGVFADLTKDTPEETVVLNLVVLTLMGIGPIAAGLYLCRWALRRDQSESKNEVPKLWVGTSGFHQTM